MTVALPTSERPWVLIASYLSAALDSLPERCVDLFFADPPYNIGVKYDGAPTDAMPRDEYLQWVEKWAARIPRVVKPNGAVFVLISEEYADEFGMILKRAIGPRTHRVIWYERFSQYNSAENSLTRAHRHLFLHHRPARRDETVTPSTFNADPIRIPSVRMKMGDKRARGPKVPDDVWEVSRLQGTSTHRVEWHPAQLPPAPLDRIVQGWSNKGDVVMDGFFGSGSMARRALHHGRRFIGVDCSPAYVKLAAARLTQEFQCQSG